MFISVALCEPSFGVSGPESGRHFKYLWIKWNENMIIAIKKNSYKCNCQVFLFFNQNKVTICENRGCVALTEPSYEQYSKRWIWNATFLKCAEKFSVLPLC